MLKMLLVLKLQPQLKILLMLKLQVLLKISAMLKMSVKMCQVCRTILSQTVEHCLNLARPAPVHLLFMCLMIKIHLRSLKWHSLMNLVRISSLGRKFSELSVVEGLVSSHNTICWLVNDSDSAIVVPKGTVVTVARSVSVNCVTEIGDFIEPDDDGSEDPVECELEAKVSKSHVPPEQARVMKDRLFSNLARFTKSNLENISFSNRDWLNLA